MATTIPYGRTPNLTLNIQSAGVDFDPATVELQVTNPAGTAATYSYGSGTITKDSTGNYSKLVPSTTVVGRWRWRWKVTQGSAIEVVEGVFDVVASNQASPI